MYLSYQHKVNKIKNKASHSGLKCLSQSATDLFDSNNLQTLVVNVDCNTDQKY